MRPIALNLLLATTILSLSATASFAAAKSDTRHSWGGSIKATMANDSNMGSAPSNPSGGAPDDEDEDSEEGDDSAFNMDELLEDDSALDDILEDTDVDNEDFNEDDAADDDGDGSIDLLDPDDTAGTPAGKSKTDSDSRMQLQFGGKHGYKLAPASGIEWRSSIKAGINAQNDRTELDRLNWAVNTGPVFKFKDIGVQINPSLSFVDVEVNDQDQMQSTIAALAGSWKVTKELALIGAYTHEMRNNEKPKATNLDVDGFKIGAAYVYGKNLFKVSYMPKWEQNDNAVKNKDKEGFELGYSRKLPWKWQADAAAKFGKTDYNTTPGREDDDSQYGLKFTKKIDGGIFFDFGAIAKYKDSSVQGKDARNHTAFMSAGYSF